MGTGKGDSGRCCGNLVIRGSEGDVMTIPYRDYKGISLRQLCYMASSSVAIVGCETPLNKRRDGNKTPQAPIPAYLPFRTLSNEDDDEGQSYQQQPQPLPQLSQGEEEELEGLSDDEDEIRSSGYEQLLNDISNICSSMTYEDKSTPSSLIGHSLNNRLWCVLMTHRPNARRDSPAERLSAWHLLVNSIVTTLGSPLCRRIIKSAQQPESSEDPVYRMHRVFEALGAVDWLEPQQQDISYEDVCFFGRHTIWGTVLGLITWSGIDRYVRGRTLTTKKNDNGKEVTTVQSARKSIVSSSIPWEYRTPLYGLAEAMQFCEGMRQRSDVR